jgi:multiple sugar transport system ATP-binding protein
MAGVRLENVRKVYPGGGGAHVAVQGIDLVVNDGEFMVLVGPSGSGKSTVLRMIAGLESITAGRVEIDGRVVNDVAAKSRDIAMVFQNYALYPHMTAYDNMAFALTLRGLAKSEIDARVRKTAAILGIEPLLARKPRQLSGGQRQRVALGRAIVREPRVFLFDEPLSNLDAKLRVQTRRELAQLHRRLGATMVYVTHDQVEAMTLGDRIAVLADGILHQVDTPMALYERPRNVFVAGFIGSPAMNLVPGEISGADDGGHLSFRAEGGTFDVPLAATWPTLHRGMRVLLGIRPEDIRVGRAGDADGAGVRARFTFAELTGNEMLVAASAGPYELTARASPRGLPEAGAEISLLIDPERVHLFDATTQESLRAPA